MKIYSNKKIIFLKESLPKFCEIIDTNHFDKNFLIDNKIEAIFIRSNEKITKELLRNTEVKFIATATSGTDHIENGIPHYSAPGSNANSVAEYVMFAISKYHNLRKLLPRKVNIGIIGYGNIGKLVAYYSYALGLNTYVNDPPLKDREFEFPEYCQYANLSEIFEQCDIITNHVPLTFSGKYATYNLINIKLLELMKPNSLLIHTSRGLVVNESHLMEILNKKNIYLAIDVWENEPGLNIQLATKSMLATPHIAGYSYDGKILATIMVLNHFQNHFGYPVNFEKLINELKNTKRIPIKEVKNTEELEKILEDSRFFKKDSNDFLNFIKIENRTIEECFVSFRNNHPNRREILEPTGNFEIMKLINSLEH